MSTLEDMKQHFVEVSGNSSGDLGTERNMFMKAIEFLCQEVDNLKEKLDENKGNSNKT